MAKQLFCSLLFALVAGVTSGNAQEAPADGGSIDKTKATKFEQFLSRTDALIVSRSYPVGKIDGPGSPVSVRVAWEVGKAEKVYAASIAYATIDFEHLQEMLDDINKMIKGINTEFDALGVESMVLKSKSGLSMSYYARSDDTNTPKRNLYVNIGQRLVGQGYPISMLVSLGNLVAQAREKLVSLGAK